MQVPDSKTRAGQRKIHRKFRIVPPPLRYDDIRTKTKSAALARGAVHAKIPRFGRANPVITCTKMAGGVPPWEFIASNFQHRSKPGREACNPSQESSSPLKRCGLKKGPSRTKQGID